MAKLVKSEKHLTHEGLQEILEIEDLINKSRVIYAELDLYVMQIKSDSSVLLFFTIIPLMNLSLTFILIFILLFILK